MGVALFAALDGREQLATPPEIAELVSLMASGDPGESAKTARLSQPRQIARAKDRRRMEVSMVDPRRRPRRDSHHALRADQDGARRQPQDDAQLPAFDPLAVFAEDGAAQTASAPTGQIYGVKVESEMSLKTVDFPIETAAFDEKARLSADEVEQVVRETGAILTDGARPGRRPALCRAGAIRRIRCHRARDQRLLWRAHRARERLGDAARRGRRPGDGLRRGDHPLHHRPQDHRCLRPVRLCRRRCHRYGRGHRRSC